MAEKEYIEREAFRREIDEHRPGRSYEDAWALTILDSIPAADVREVVVCGECEFWNRKRISCEGLARCNTGESGIRYRNRSDFCSRGKKREG